MATATSVITTARAPCGSTTSVMNSDARAGTYVENRDHTTSTATRISEIELPVTGGDQHLGRGQDRDHLLAMGRRGGHLGAPPGQVALNGRRTKAMAVSLFRIGG